MPCNHPGNLSLLLYNQEKRPNNFSLKRIWNINSVVLKKFLPQLIWGKDEAQAADSERSRHKDEAGMKRGEAGLGVSTGGDLL